MNIEHRILILEVHRKSTSDNEYKDWELTERKWKV